MLPTVRGAYSAKFFAGIDEVGRGPLAGPVVAATVVLDPRRPIEGLNDSKLLSARKRQAICKAIQRSAFTWAVGHASVEEVDELNVLQASLLAMQRSFQTATMKVQQPVERALVDGNKAPNLSVCTECVVGGDRKVPAISAASILAKVTRDYIMCEAATYFPLYGFEQHKGYPTRMHLQQLEQHGSCAYHRQSFRPVQEANNRLI